jgi:hypothetical protein
MNRLFDIGLDSAPNWTDGEAWEECNPAQRVGNVYHRIYSASEEEDIPTYRIEPGDNFFIGANPSVIRDWTPKLLPWEFDIDAELGAEYSFYFGVQAGVDQIDVNLENHSPWIVKVAGEFINLSADYHRFFGLKFKDSDPVITLKKAITGTEIHGAVLNNTPLIETNGYPVYDWKLRNITLLNAVQKALDIPASSRGVSSQRLFVTGSGDIGVVVRAGHSEMEIIGGTLVNENHGYREIETLYHGVEIEAGGKATVRHLKIHGFSGNATRFLCEVDTKGITSERNGSGLYFAENSTARDCQINWLRQVAGDSYGYYAAKELELNNCGCQLDETGGLGVIAMGEGATVTVNGGDYFFKEPLPFVAALGTSTIVLNKVTINGTIYNETVNLLKGESWRGVKSPVIIETLPVYANQLLVQPYMHMPDLVNAVSVQGSERPFENVITLPSGAKLTPTKFGSVRYFPGEYGLDLDPGETKEDTFRWSTEDNIYIHKFIIGASLEVGAKVVQTDAFSGTGWVKDGAKYTANGTSNALTANATFEENEIYEISVMVSSISAGSFRPEFDGSTPKYSHEIEGREVWLIRAPANTTQVKIAPSSFSGAVENIYVRKLLRTETPPTPELEATVNGNDVNIAWYLPPIERISDTSTPRVYITGELNYAIRDGYFDRDGGHYLFEGVYSVAKKSGVNLRGGDALEVYKMQYTGGYTGEYDQYQTAIAPEMNGGPYFTTMQVCYLKGDLLLSSNRGSYQAEFGNTDGIVGNGRANIETSDAKLLVLGMSFKNASDSIIDTKKYTEVNHSTLDGAYRQFRVHTMGTGLVANCDFLREYGTKECFAPTHSFAFISIWNTYADGVRCVTKDQMVNQVNADGLYSSAGVADVYKHSVEVLKTYPTINDLCRVAMTDMEFQISGFGSSSWYGLNFSDVDLPGVIGAFERTANFSSGDYQIRCRCLNGALVGAWSNTITITV